QGTESLLRARILDARPSYVKQSLRISDLATKTVTPDCPGGSELPLHLAAEVHARQRSGCDRRCRLLGRLSLSDEVSLSQLLVRHRELFCERPQCHGTQYPSGNWIHEPSLRGCAAQAQRRGRPTARGTHPTLRGAGSESPTPLC